MIIQREKKRTPTHNQKVMNCTFICMDVLPIYLSAIISGLVVVEATGSPDIGAIDGCELPWRPRSTRRTGGAAYHWPTSPVPTQKSFIIWIQPPCFFFTVFPSTKWSTAKDRHIHTNINKLLVIWGVYSRLPLTSLGSCGWPWIRDSPAIPSQMLTSEVCATDSDVVKC